MKRKGKKWLALVLLLGGAALASWWRYGEGQKQAKSPEATVEVTRRDLTATVLAVGTVKPQMGAEVRVGARISGKVEHLYANIVDVVKKGEVIAELEKSDLEAKVAQRQAELQIAEASLSAVQTLRPREIEKAEADAAKWQASLILAKKELSRQDDLLKQAVASQGERDTAQERLSVTEAELAATHKALELARAQYTEDLQQAQANIERAKAVIANARVQLSYATITAPISGVIASVSTQEGETVAAGLNAPTFVTSLTSTGFRWTPTWAKWTSVRSRSASGRRLP